MPHAPSAVSARGVINSPHALPIGDSARSITATRCPLAASAAAVAAPAGPAPTTSTSASTTLRSRACAAGRRALDGFADRDHVVESLVDREQVAAAVEVGEDLRLLGAPLLVLLGVLSAEIGATKGVALVAHHPEQFLTGEHVTLGGHHGTTAAGHVWAALTVGVAVDLDPGGVVTLRTPVHPPELILDVREGPEHLALGEGIPDATSAGRTVTACTGAEDLLTHRERPGHLFCL